MGAADNNFALVRYTSTGALDSTFGTGGIVTTSLSNYTQAAQALVLQSNQQIVVAGYCDGTATMAI